MKSVQLQLSKPFDRPKDYVKDIQYNAKGQRISIQYGNGTVSTYEYERETFRLESLKTHRSSDSPDKLLQNISYVYDPAGTDDRAPTLDEIHKIIEYPDRRIKPIAYTMASSGIRVGAWDHLKWSLVSPIIRDSKLLAAKINVYAGEDDEYITFITPEAYLSLESWMKYRSTCGEHVTKDSWVMRDLWNAAKLPKKEEKGKINEPIKLQSVGIRRLVERALWAQGIRTELESGRRSHEFQTDHGFRKQRKNSQTPISSATAPVRRKGPVATSTKQMAGMGSAPGPVYFKLMLPV